MQAFRFPKVFPGGTAFLTIHNCCSTMTTYFSISVFAGQLEVLICNNTHLDSTMTTQVSITAFPGGTAFVKMAEETPEVRSDKSLTLLTFDI